MWIANNWNDYEVIDTSCGEKLERWGKYTLVRPAAGSAGHMEYRENRTWLAQNERSLPQEYERWRRMGIFSPASGMEHSV